MKHARRIDNMCKMEGCDSIAEIDCEGYCRNCFENGEAEKRAAEGE